VYLLDTNVVSLALRGLAPRVVSKLAGLRRSDVAVSVITEMELCYGLARRPSARTRDAVEGFLHAIPIAPLPDDIAPVYGEVRAELERKGRPIGALDTIIAAHALAIGAVLVTDNVREFRRVPRLTCENWIR
jgi:tRNA(fMet)-specific endonuclease VapC